MVKKRESTEVRQKQIIDAARKVIIKFGSENVTIRRIAKEVGVTEAAVYRHFPSKKEILSVLCEEVGHVLDRDVTDAVNRGGTSLEILDNLIQTQLYYIEQRRGIAFHTIAEVV